MASRRSKVPQRNYSDEDWLYSPAWLSGRSGFLNLKEREAQEFNDLIDAFVPRDVRHWDCREDGWIFLYPETSVSITNHSEEESFTTNVSSRPLPLNVAERMSSDLQRMLHSESTKVGGVLDFATLILRLLEAASAYLLAWRDEVRSTKLGLRPGNKGWQHGWDANFVTDWESILDNPFGLSLDSIADTAHHILGLTPKQICAGIPKGIRVLHCESVLRKDLADRFLRRQAMMWNHLSGRPHDELRACVPREKGKSLFSGNGKGKDDLVENLVRPRLTFHGTMNQFVGSIVRYGFLKPGQRLGNTEKAVEVRCGNTYGRGIYSSPDVSFSLSYIGSSATAVQSSDVPSVRLIVCATIMGRAATLTRDDNWRLDGHAYPNSDSHVANNGMEYIVFAASQILPCYVIHVDWGSEEARRAFDNVPEDPNVWVEARARKQNKTHPRLEKHILYPGDKVRLQAAKQAAAAKWFPFGYGTAKGESFKIEEIGEISDDEENYGAYQPEAIQASEYPEYSEEEAEDREHKGQYWFDQYYVERTTQLHVKIRPDD